MIEAFYLDEPAVGMPVQRHGFTVQGWIRVGNGTAVSGVLVESGGHTLGSTRMMFPRSDVNAAFALEPSTPTGFLVSCSVPASLRIAPDLPILVTAVSSDGQRTIIDSRTLSLSAYDYRSSGHGYLLEDGFVTIMPREHVYGSGPPAPEVHPEVLGLILRYLRPGERVLDVGCGIGAVGRAFRERGIPWIGCEVREDFVARARADGLDARLATEGRLPFEDGSFDVAIAIEVLEHVREPHPFLWEMHRVAPRGAMLSVPNFEAIPVTSAFYAVPWHMMEADHWNFYSRGSLKAAVQTHYPYAEVFEYGALPLMKSLDGIRVYNHLFAVARETP